MNFEGVFVIVNKTNVKLLSLVNKLKPWLWIACQFLLSHFICKLYIFIGDSNKNQNNYDEWTWCII